MTCPSTQPGKGRVQEDPRPGVGPKGRWGPKDVGGSTGAALPG